ncbi:uncharacterized protein LOC111103619 [Crassostrea virginica]
MSGSREGGRLCKGHVGDKNYRKLQRSVSRIKKNLDVESVLDDLISAEVLSIEDGMDIRHEKKPHAMADVLIQKLIYVGEHGYSIFENVLREHRYGYLVEDIEPVNDRLNSPTESLDPSPIITTPSSEIHHHVHFLEQPKYLDPPPPRKSILSKPLYSGEGEYVNIHDGRPGKEDEDEDEEIVEPEGGAEVSKADSIPLSEPIKYTGPSSKLTAWYPKVHMDPNLCQFPGCHPDVDERKIKNIVKENKDREGSYVIWYSTQRKLLIITVIKKDSPKGRYHYKVKCRKLEPEQEMVYRFSSQKETKSVVELLEYVLTAGLPPPVQKKRSS